MTKDPRVYLAQILERLQRIASFTSGGEAVFRDVLIPRKRSPGASQSTSRLGVGALPFAV